MMSGSIVLGSSTVFLPSSSSCVVIKPTGLLYANTIVSIGTEFALFAGPGRSPALGGDAPGRFLTPFGPFSVGESGKLLSGSILRHLLRGGRGGRPPSSSRHVKDTTPARTQLKLTRLERYPHRADSENPEAW
eukprot:755466-Hanusia_phi.AAC.7